MTGIKEIKEVLGFIAAVGNAVGKSLEDGSFGLEDIGNALPILQTAIPAFTGLNEIDDEFLDLTSEEVKELEDYLVAEFNIPQDDVESRVEEAIYLVGALIEFLAPFFKKEETE